MKNRKESKSNVEVAHTLYVENVIIILDYGTAKHLCRGAIKEWIFYKQQVEIHL